MPHAVILKGKKKKSISLLNQYLLFKVPLYSLGGRVYQLQFHKFEKKNNNLRHLLKSEFNA